MTDLDAQSGRVDFGVLNEDLTFANVERVMTQVHAHRARSARSHPVRQCFPGATALVALGMHARPIAMAASILIVVSLLFIAIPVRPAAPLTPPDVLAIWISRHHIPTNGELVRTFQGYGR